MSIVLWKLKPTLQNGNLRMSSLIVSFTLTCISLLGESIKASLVLCVRVIKSSQRSLKGTREIFKCLLQWSIYGAQLEKRKLIGLNMKCLNFCSWNLWFFRTLTWNVCRKIFSTSVEYEGLLKTRSWIQNP